MSALASHLSTGLTHVCRCWAVIRRDGRVLGFTDHDCELSFDDITFKADSGLTARMLEQVTGLAADNTEAMGALSDAAITEEDIVAGRYDGAEVKSWLVNWRDLSERTLVFAGTIGELRRVDGAFYAELRGLSEALNQPVGTVYQGSCQAILGDGKCRADLDVPGYRYDTVADQVTDARVFRFEALPGIDDRWFERGRLEVLSGAAEGLVAIIKNDRSQDGARVIELWEALRAEIAPGDQLRLEAGCDKRRQTCRLKFNNIANFRGFPHIPGEDWLVGYPSASGRNDGGSRYQ